MFLARNLLKFYEGKNKFELRNLTLNIFIVIGLSYGLKASDEFYWVLNCSL